MSLLSPRITEKMNEVLLCLWFGTEALNSSVAWQLLRESISALSVAERYRAGMRRFTPISQLLFASQSTLKSSCCTLLTVAKSCASIAFANWRTF